MALIGASNDPATFTGAPAFNLLRHGYEGAIYPVNPTRSEVAGLPCFPSVADIPSEVDAAIITVSAARAIDALKSCADKGIEVATLVSSGFGEGGAGAAGAGRQQELEKVLADGSLRVLGPNTTGVINLRDRYVPRAAANHLHAKDLHAGPVALVTQSGACSNIVFNRAQSAGVPVGTVVATGGQVDINIWEVVTALLDRPDDTVVMVVAEDFTHVDHFEEAAAKAADLGKSIVILKLGQSAAGSAAVQAHSASVAGDARVQRATCRALGIHWVDDFDQLHEVAALLCRWGRPDRQRRRLGVFAFSGGEGALVADAAGRARVEMPQPGPALASVVTGLFEYTLPANPFDPSGEVIGRPELVADALKAFVDDPSFTDVLVASPIFGQRLGEKLYPHLTEALRGTDRRVMLSSWTAPGLTEWQERTLRGTGHPWFSDSTRAVNALAVYGDVALTIPTRETTTRLPGLRAVPVDASYFALREELKGAGVPFGTAFLCHTPDEAVLAASDIGYPLVLKANVESSGHKSARGLVSLGITGPYRLREEAERLLSLEPAGVVVEAQAVGELQLFLGIHRDDVFGPALAFGTGGISVEGLDDIEVIPLRRLTTDDIPAFLARTTAGRTLASRDRRTSAALARTVDEVCSWFLHQDGITSLDLNPIVINLTDHRIVCVDARVA